MLAKPTKGVEIILARFEGITFTCEYKYDGFRGQLHFDKEGVLKIFSRNLEDMTSAYPDALEYIKNYAPEGVKNCVFDCEIVPYDVEKDKILPF